MEKLYLALLIFCKAICLASSFKCYECSGQGDGEYAKEQCEKDQKEVWCNSTQAMPRVCIRWWGKKTDGKKLEYRDCVHKSVCEDVKKDCSDEEKEKELKVKECEARCCQLDLCNSAFSTYAREDIATANMMMMMFAALCGVLLF